MTVGVFRLIFVCYYSAGKNENPTKLKKKIPWIKVVSVDLRSSEIHIKVVSWFEILDKSEKSKQERKFKFDGTTLKLSKKTTDELRVSRLF